MDIIRLGIISLKLFILEESSQFKDWWAHGGSGCALIGFLFCLSALIPLYKSMVKYKNTIWTNKKVFVFQLLSAILYFYGASFFLGHSIIEKRWASVPTGALFAILNWIASMGNLYIVLLKSKNVRESKDLGITEAEHYEKVYAPLLETEKDI